MQELLIIFAGQTSFWSSKACFAHLKSFKRVSYGVSILAYHHVFEIMFFIISSKKDDEFAWQNVSCVKFEFEVFWQYILKLSLTNMNVFVSTE